MRTIYQHVTDPSVVLGSGESLCDTHIVQGGTTVGRVLFARRDPSVLVTGWHVRIADCHIEGALDPGWEARDIAALKVIQKAKRRRDAMRGQ